MPVETRPYLESLKSRTILDVQIERDEFRAAQRRNKRERERERKNWRAYDATEFGQFEERALALMIQEGRPPTSMNIIKRYVDTITGSIVADGYDIHYETELGEDNNIAMLFKELYLEDKDLGNFQGEYLELVRAGFIYRGWMEMFVDRERDPRGRVALRFIPSDRVVTDPDWTTHKVKDNKKIWTQAWMSPQQIKDRFHKNSAEINNAIELFKLSRGGDSSARELDKLFDTSPEFFDEQNGLYLVASQMELVRERKKVLFDIETQTMLPQMSEEDMDHFLFAAKMQGQRIESMTRQVNVCKVKTFAPGLSLDLVLEKGPHNLQLNTYPLFCFSSDCLNGRPNTPVDQLYDVQATINNREASITHILQTTSHNTLLIEEDATSDPDDAIKISQGRNRPGAGYLVRSGANREQAIRYMEKNQPPTDLMRHNDSMLAMAERVTPAVPALQGIGDEGDSGVLFQAKVAQAQVGIQIPSKFLKAFWHDIGDAYFMAAQQTYTYPMIFMAGRNKAQFVLNQEGGIWMDQISRLRVTISQSPTSETYRRELLKQFVSLSQYIADPLTKQALTRLSIKSIPNVPEEELEALAETAKLSEDLARAKVMLEFLNTQMQIRQAQAQLMPPQPGQVPGASPGMPAGPPGAAPQPARPALGAPPPTPAATV